MCLSLVKWVKGNYERGSGKGELARKCLLLAHFRHITCKKVPMEIVDLETGSFRTLCVCTDLGKLWGSPGVPLVHF